MTLLIMDDNYLTEGSSCDLFFNLSTLAEQGDHVTITNKRNHRAVRAAGFRSLVFETLWP